MSFSQSSNRIGVRADPVLGRAQEPSPPGNRQGALVAAWCDEVGASEESAGDLLRVAEFLTPLAAVVRADVSLAVLAPDGSRCLTVAEARSRSVRPLYSHSRVGQAWSLRSDAAAWSAVRTARPVFSRHTYLVAGEAVCALAVPLRWHRLSACATDVQDEILGHHSTADDRVEGPVRALLLIEWAARYHPGPRHRRALSRAGSGLLHRFPTGSLTPRDIDAIMRLAVGVVVAPSSGRSWMDEEYRRQSLHAAWFPTAADEGRHPEHAAGHLSLAPGIPAGALPLETAEGDGWHQYLLIWGEPTVVKTDILLGPATAPAGWLFALETLPLRLERSGNGIRSVVLQEVHHRVKNNLQTIASLLRLQARRAHGSEIHEALATATDRVMSVAAIYDCLARDGQESVELWDVLERLVDAARQADPLRSGASPDTPERIQWLLRGDRVRLAAAYATPIALAVNELLHNAARHAFPDGRRGTVRVEVRQDDQSLTITVADDGWGFLSTAERPAETSGLGLQLVQRLVEQDLQGQFTATGDNGTRAEIRIPI